MKLLLVDDDYLERIALRNMLRAQGPWTIEESRSGEEALERLALGPNPAAAFFDVRMPGMDGVELLTRVRQDQALRHLKVVMTSGNRDRETIVSLGKLGIAAYLTKPYEVQKTSAILNQVLGSAPMTSNNLVARNLLAKTVLVVDDDILVRSSLRELFRNDPDWELVEAEDGLAALELLRGGLRPDIVVLDLKMPNLDGPTLLARIREDPNLRRTPVVVASGQHDREQIRSLAQLRISGYLLKPFDLVKTHALVQQVVSAGNVGSAAPM